MALAAYFAIGAVALMAAGATVLFLLKGRRRPSPNKLQARQITAPPPPVSAAASWLNERTEKLRGKLAELLELVRQLQLAGEWNAEDARRLSMVEAEVEDYLSSMAERPVENMHAYRELFHSGPYTTVPFNASGWSISWGVWMVDAHLELLIRQAVSRLRIRGLDGEKLEYEKRFLQEIEDKIGVAGYNGSPYFPRFKMENITRDVTRSRLVRFEKTPFGLTPEQAVDEIRVAESMPDIGEMVDNLPSRPRQDDFMRMFKDYRTAVDRSWRVLTAEEKASVLQALNHNSNNS